MEPEVGHGWVIGEWKPARVVTSPRRGSDVRGINAEVRSPITLHDHPQVTPMYIGSPHCTSMAIVLIVYEVVSDVV
jgi:hypothetical protein